jgi:SAM-dependent methyltransferase
MANVEQNLDVWNRWDWSHQGDEWSAWWGGTEAMWYGALLPRIHSFVPAGRVLEIAPGFGRWTQYLKDRCDSLTVVDLTEQCIEHCRERFANESHIEYHVNDGRSLGMVEDDSIDFAFSFDSLVHVEADVIESYLRDLATKLKPNAVGVIHHSNAGELRRLASISRRVPRRALPVLVRRGIALDVAAWRAESMSANLFVEQCQRVGLSCIAQEKLSWEHGPHLIDTISIFTPAGSSHDRPLEVVRNPLFRREALRMKSLYARRRIQPSG